MKKGILVLVEKSVDRDLFSTVAPTDESVEGLPGHLSPIAILGNGGGLHITTALCS